VDGRRYYTVTANVEEGFLADPEKYAAIARAEVGIEEPEEAVPMEAEEEAPKTAEGCPTAE